MCVHQQQKKTTTIALGPRSHAAWVACWPASRCGLVLLELHLHLFFFSFFLFFLSFFFFFFAVSAVWVINNNYFWLEIESVDITWKKYHIGREQPIKIEF